MPVASVTLIYIVKAISLFIANLLTLLWKRHIVSYYTQAPKVIARRDGYRGDFDQIAHSSILRGLQPWASFIYE